MKNTAKKLAAATIFVIILLAGNSKVYASEVRSLNQIVETTLKVENWMIDPSLSPSDFDFTIELSQETENKLEIENWMIDTNVINLNGLIVEESDMDLKIESWMITNDLNLVMEPIIEEELSLEDWMIN